jgi:hypothetical protein
MRAINASLSRDNLGCMAYLLGNCEIRALYSFDFIDAVAREAFIAQAAVLGGEDAAESMKVMRVEVLREWATVRHRIFGPDQA